MKISWLKLDVGILDDAKIKIIRHYPDGNALFVLWVGLLCMAMQGNRSGVVELTEGMAYTDAELARILDLEEKTVSMGLAIFQKLQMIDRIEGGMVEIRNFRKHQELEKIENIRESDRKRQAERRERLRLAHVTRESLGRHADVTQQTRQDYTRLDKIKEEEIHADASAPPVSNDHQTVIAEYHRLHLETTQTKPVIDSRTGKIVKDLLKCQPLNTILEKLRMYYTTDEWYTKGGRSIGGFRANYDRIELKKAKPKNWVDQIRAEVEAENATNR